MKGDSYRRRSCRKRFGGCWSAGRLYTRIRPQTKQSEYPSRLDRGILRVHPLGCCSGRNWRCWWRRSSIRGRRSLLRGRWSHRRRKPFRRSRCRSPRSSPGSSRCSRSWCVVSLRFALGSWRLRWCRFRHCWATGDALGQYIRCGLFE